MPKLIVDGVIYDGEDDPALIVKRQREEQQRARERAPTQTQGPGAAAPGFNLSAPPMRVIPHAGAFGLPDFEVYGFRLSAATLIVFLFVGLKWGWQAVVGGLVLFYIYTVSQGAPGAAPGGLADLLGFGTSGVPPPQAAQAQAGAGPSGPRSAPVDPAAGGGAFTGKARKLTD